MNEPFVSVILPTYNRCEMTRRAVRSVLWQEERDWELLVMDDGSTDATRDLVAEFKDEPRVRWTRFENNRGQHACRNDAIKAARGGFITFLDSDDMYLPERLAVLRMAAEDRPEVGFWFTNAYTYRYGRVIGRLFDPGRAIPEGKLPGWYAVGDRHLPYLTSNIMLKRENFEQVGTYREDLKILEDCELYARMLAAGVEVGVVRECLAVRTLHEGQITHDYAVDYEESLIALRSGGAPPEFEAAFARQLAREIGVYYLKDLQPKRAREFLAKAGEGWTPLYAATLLPVPVLAGLRGMRRVFLASGGTQVASSKEFKAVEAKVESLG